MPLERLAEGSAPASVLGLLSTWRTPAEVPWAARAPIKDQFARGSRVFSVESAVFQSSGKGGYGLMELPLRRSV